MVWSAITCVLLTEMIAALPCPFFSLVGIILLEISLLEKTLILRLVQTALLLIILKNYPSGFALAGMEKNRLPTGIRTGIIWSSVFGMAIGLGGGVLFLFGINPLELVASPIPFKGTSLALFFFTGGLVAPVAEELFFRGILYSWLRRFSVPMAVVGTTFFFAFCHIKGFCIPIFQLTGGLVFAIAFERTQSLAAPVIIHILGNLTLFSLSCV